MSGDDSCEWQRWFKAHYENYEKLPNDFDAVKWMMNHTKLLRETREDYRKVGYRVSVEDQNKLTLSWFTKTGTEVTLAGKPDLMALSEDGTVLTIIDAKTGKANISHRFQVLIYIVMEKIARLSRFKYDSDVLREIANSLSNGDAIIDGLLIYPESKDQIPSTMLTEEFEDTLNYWLDIVGGKNEPEKTPSKRECDWCDIAVCDARIK